MKGKWEAIKQYLLSQRHVVKKYLRDEFEVRKKGTMDEVAQNEYLRGYGDAIKDVLEKHGDLS